MTDDDLIERATEALADHVLGARWVCVCGAECWQADAGAGGACVIASNGYHREHQARAVLDAIDLPGLIATAKAEAWGEAIATARARHYGINPDEIKPYRWQARADKAEAEVQRLRDRITALADAFENELAELAVGDDLSGPGERVRALLAPQVQDKPDATYCLPSLQEPCGNCHRCCEPEAGEG